MFQSEIARLRKLGVQGVCRSTFRSSARSLCIVMGLAVLGRRRAVMAVCCRCSLGLWEWEVGHAVTKPSERCRTRRS